MFLCSDWRCWTWLAPEFFWELREPLLLPPHNKELSVGVLVRILFAVPVAVLLLLVVAACSGLSEDERRGREEFVAACVEPGGDQAVCECAFDATLAAIPIEEWDEFDFLKDGKLNPELVTIVD